MPDNVISLADFKSDTNTWIKHLQQNPPVVLTQNGRAAVVVQSYASYKRTQEALALLATVARTEVDYAAGRTPSSDADLVEVSARVERALKELGYA